MPTIFKVRARRAKDGTPVQAFVSIGGTSWQGYTLTNGDYVIVELSQTGSYDWHAKYDGRTVDKGRQQGGTIEIIV
jgi:hypothetical protein